MTAQADATMRPEVLTLQEVADILRIGITTAKKLAASGELRAFKAGKNWRVRRDALDAYMDGLE